MPFYRFKPNDIYINTVKTYPKTIFTIYQSGTYLNNYAATGSNPYHPDGHLNLYELNVGKPAPSTFGNESVTLPIAYQYLTKQNGWAKFKSISTGSYFNSASYGDQLSGSLPMTGTIEAFHYSTASWHCGLMNLEHMKSLPAYAEHGLIPKIFKEGEEFKDATGADVGVYHTRSKIKALRNTIDYYAFMSPHFQYSSSFGDTAVLHNRDFDHCDLTVLSIPALFYGQSIRKGSVRLKYYVTGTLVAEAQDHLYNGELINVTDEFGNSDAGTYAPDYGRRMLSGSVVGLVLYNEGILILTSSRNLYTQVATGDNLKDPAGNSVFAYRYTKEVFRPGMQDDNLEHPRWIHFGSTMWTGSSTPSSSWQLEFEGINEVPTMTMLAHAERGHINHSNNPTYLDFDNTGSFFTSSHGYIESAEEKVFNIASSSYSHHSASFDKQVFINKIAIYDSNKNIIAIAKLANPYRKNEEDSITFKMKLDL